MPRGNGLTKDEVKIIASKAGLLNSREIGSLIGRGYKTVEPRAALEGISLKVTNPPKTIQAPRKKKKALRMNFSLDQPAKIVRPEPKYSNGPSPYGIASSTRQL